jgi:predicted thioesterase
MGLKVGIKGESSEIVTKEKTASYIGSGLVEVYATPFLLALMEKAAVEAIEPFLEEDETSVGIKANFAHLKATPVDMKVKAIAELIVIEGRKLVWQIEAYDEIDKIGEGTHERFIVKREKFLAEARNKLKRSMTKKERTNNA